MKYLKTLLYLILSGLVFFGVYEFKKYQNLKVSRSLELLKVCPPGAMIQVTANTRYFSNGLTISCAYINDRGFSLKFEKIGN